MRARVRTFSHLGIILEGSSEEEKIPSKIFFFTIIFYYFNYLTSDKFNFDKFDIETYFLMLSDKKSPVMNLFLFLIAFFHNDFNFRFHFCFDFILFYFFYFILF